MDYKKTQDIGFDSTQQYGHPALMQPQDDVINLLDVWRTLAKRKTLISAVSLIVTLVGIAYATLRPDMYVYSTAIQIGSLFVDGNEKPVEDAKSLVIKLKTLYENTVLKDFYQENPQEEKIGDIGISVPKDSRMIIISSKNPEKSAPVYDQLIGKISTTAVNDLNVRIKIFRNQLTEQIADVKKNLERLNIEETGLNNRIQEFDKLFKSAPIENGGTTALVLTGLAGQRQQIADEKAKLEAKLTNKLVDLGLTQDTKVLFPVTRSVDPVGIGKIPVILISLIAGLILGVFTALLWDQIDKTNAQIDTH